MKLSPLPFVRDLALRLLGRTDPADAPAAAVAGPDLRSSRALKALLTGEGRTIRRAMELTLDQVGALRSLVASDEGWARLQRLFAVRHLDSWLADDWPRSFDELVVCAGLCEVVAFECGRCPVGQTQDGRNCSSPDTAFGRIGILVGAGDLPGLRAYLAELEPRLRALPVTAVVDSGGALR